MLSLLPIIPYYLYIYSTNLFLECLGFSHSSQTSPFRRKSYEAVHAESSQTPPSPTPTAPNMLKTLKIHWSFSVAQACCCKLTIQKLQLIDMFNKLEKSIYSLQLLYLENFQYVHHQKVLWSTQHGWQESHFSCLSKVLSTLTCGGNNHLSW